MPVASPSAPHQASPPRRVLHDADRLLPLALSQPAKALIEADRLLAGRPSSREASVARQARGIILRDNGDIEASIAELRTALRLAVDSGDAPRVADTKATLGATLGVAGRTAEGLDLLDQAVRSSTGGLAGQILTRRAALLRVLGRYDAALGDLRRAIHLQRRAGDAVWEARSRMNRFAVYVLLGRTAEADRELVQGERLFIATGQQMEAAMMVHNRADLAYQAGDLPAALDLLDRAQRRYRGLGVYNADLARDRSRTLLAAGLADEAAAVAGSAVRNHVERGGYSTKTAELLLAAGRAALAAGRPKQAAAWAGEARDLVVRQGRHGLRLRADHILVQSRYALGERGAALAGLASGLADQLDALSAAEAPAAHLLAGRLATGHSGR
ncbi:MAG: hypothetical protein J2P15_12915, partial [Micromonosporaceae bacterium]|nr:hypothetical protein [Micromonosporaceae bacterium]